MLMMLLLPVIQLLPCFEKLFRIFASIENCGIDHHVDFSSEPVIKF